mmetsp:Transcript_21280/g.34038  ORF Transcript_21280/g.34038 Transcript_21280/m.34038 type:complete len:206 (-) Transcript_21280:391-1008(-)
MELLTGKAIISITQHRAQPESTLSIRHLLGIHHAHHNLARSLFLRILRLRPGQDLHRPLLVLSLLNDLISKRIQPVSSASIIHRILRGIKCQVRMRDLSVPRIADIHHFLLHHLLLHRLLHDDHIGTRALLGVLRVNLRRRLRGYFGLDIRIDLHLADTFEDAAERVQQVLFLLAVGGLALCQNGRFPVVDGFDQFVEFVADLRV